MNRFFRHTVIILTLAFIVGSTASQASAQGVLTEVLRRMDMYNKSLQSLQANVTMEKYNPQLDVSDTTIGMTSYLPKNGKQPMYIRIDWTRPAEEQIAVIGDKYELYRPRLKQVIKGTVDRKKNSSAAGGALAFMNMSRAELRANYEIQVLGEENVKDASSNVLTWRLLLTPKARTSYKTAELWVDQNGTPRQVKITEHNNDTTTVRLENMKKNITLNANIFKLNIPRDAKVVGANH